MTTSGGGDEKTRLFQELVGAENWRDIASMSAEDAAKLVRKPIIPHPPTETPMIIQYFPADFEH